MRRLKPQLLLCLSAAFAITVLALVAPLSAATLSRRAGAVHTRGQLTRGVQTSRLGVSGDAIEGGAGGAVSSDALLGPFVEYDAQQSVHVPFGVTPRVTGIGFVAYNAITTAAPASVHNNVVALASPRGPPTARP